MRECDLWKQYRNWPLLITNRSKKDLSGLPWPFPVSTVQLWLFHIWLNPPSSVWKLNKPYSVGNLSMRLFLVWSSHQPGVSTSLQKATPLPSSWKELHSWPRLFERGWCLSSVTDIRLAKIKRRTLESSEDLQATPSFTHLGTPNNESVKFEQVETVQSCHCKLRRC